MQRSAKIFDFELRRDHRKMSYERCDCVGRRKEPILV